MEPNNLQEKTIKLQNKFEKKLKIIEENVKLSEEEKQKVYKKLKKQIRHQQLSNIKKGNAKANLSNFSKYIAGDNDFNKIFGGVGLAVVIIGILGLLSNFNSTGLAVFLGATPVGLLAMYNTYLNSPREDGSLLDKLIKEDRDYRIATNDVLEEIYKKIPNTQNLEIEGR